MRQQDLQTISKALVGDELGLGIAEGWSCSQGINGVQKIHHMTVQVKCYIAVRRDWDEEVPLAEHGWSC